MGKKSQPFDGLPAIERTIKAESKAVATDRARDGYGRVICEHCSREIRDDQQITFNHKFQWQDLRGQYAADRRFHELSTNSQRKFLTKLYNDPENLQPLHVACHREVDFGMHFTPDEEDRINRKLSVPTPIVHAVAIEAKDRASLLDWYAEYRILLSQPDMMLTRSGWLRIEGAPYVILREAERITHKKIEQLERRVEQKLSSPEIQVTDNAFAIPALRAQQGELRGLEKKLEALITQRYPQNEPLPRSR